MGEIDLREIVFSKQIEQDFSDSLLFEKIKSDESFVNPKSV
jgi:hypothetical protein